MKDCTIRNGIERVESATTKVVGMRTIGKNKAQTVLWKYGIEYKQGCPCLDSQANFLRLKVYLFQTKLSKVSQILQATACSIWKKRKTHLFQIGNAFPELQLDKVYSRSFHLPMWKAVLAFPNPKIKYGKLVQSPLFVCLLQVIFHDAWTVICNVFFFLCGKLQLNFSRWFVCMHNKPSKPRTSSLQLLSNTCLSLCIIVLILLWANSTWN